MQHGPESSKTTYIKLCRFSVSLKSILVKCFEVNTRMNIESVIKNSTNRNFPINKTQKATPLELEINHCLYEHLNKRLKRNVLSFKATMIVKLKHLIDKHRIQIFDPYSTPPNWQGTLLEYLGKINNPTESFVHFIEQEYSEFIDVMNGDIRIKLSTHGANQLELLKREHTVYEKRLRDLYCYHERSYKKRLETLLKSPIGFLMEAGADTQCTEYYHIKTQKRSSSSFRSDEMNRLLLILLSHPKNFTLKPIARIHGSIGVLKQFNTDFNLQERQQESSILLDQTLTPLLGVLETITPIVSLERINRLLQEYFKDDLPNEISELTKRLGNKIERDRKETQQFLAAQPKGPLLSLLKQYQQFKKIEHSLNIKNWEALSENIQLLFNRLNCHLVDFFTKVFPKSPSIKSVSELHQHINLVETTFQPLKQETTLNISTRLRYFLEHANKKYHQHLVLLIENLKKEAKSLKSDLRVNIRCLNNYIELSQLAQVMERHNSAMQSIKSNIDHILIKTLEQLDYNDKTILKNCYQLIPVGILYEFLRHVISEKIGVEIHQKLVQHLAKLPKLLQFAHRNVKTSLKEYLDLKHQLALYLGSIDFLDNSIIKCKLEKHHSTMQSFEVNLLQLLLVNLSSLLQTKTKSPKSIKNLINEYKSNLTLIPIDCRNKMTAPLIEEVDRLIRLSLFDQTIQSFEQLTITTAPQRKRAKSHLQKLKEELDKNPDDECFIRLERLSKELEITSNPSLLFSPLAATSAAFQSITKQIGRIPSALPSKKQLLDPFA